MFLDRVPEQHVPTSIVPELFRCSGCSRQSPVQREFTLTTKELPDPKEPLSTDLEEKNYVDA